MSHLDTHSFCDECGSAASQQYGVVFLCDLCESEIRHSVSLSRGNGTAVDSSAAPQPTAAVPTNSESPSSLVGDRQTVAASNLDRRGAAAVEPFVMPDIPPFLDRRNAATSRIRASNSIPSISTPASE